MVGGCASFSAHLTAVFEVTGARGLTRLTSATEQADFMPLGAVDLNGDGVPEFVTGDGITERQGDGYQVREVYAAAHPRASAKSAVMRKSNAA